ncbi:LOW QUALITY PROTEIN: DHQ_synthase domain-containing protein, partial [Cephalotus follicularis]
MCHKKKERHEELNEIVAVNTILRAYADACYGLESVDAIETGSGYGQWLHGEAVAAGIVMAVDMSYRLGWLEDSIVKRVDNILKRAKLPVVPPEMMTVEMFKSVMAVRELFIILLKGPLVNCVDCVFTGDYDRKALDDALHAFCK